jgi:predicted rRNA methylase YqxC with S4 and FtsJ domains
MKRKRADILLVEAGLFDSRAKARAAIEAGSVKADGKVVTSPRKSSTRPSCWKPSPPIPGWDAAP